MYAMHVLHYWTTSLTLIYLLNGWSNDVMITCINGTEEINESYGFIVYHPLGFRTIDKLKICRVPALQSSLLLTVTPILLFVLPRGECRG